MMPYNPVDPANLEGEDLTNWYLRSPQEIEQQRQASAQQRYQDFFYGDGADRRTANVATPSQTSSLARPVVDSGTYGGSGLATRQLRRARGRGRWTELRHVPRSAAAADPGAPLAALPVGLGRGIPDVAGPAGYHRRWWRFIEAARARSEAV
jgi:hypothetical protein